MQICAQIPEELADGASTEPPGSLASAAANKFVCPNDLPLCLFLDCLQPGKTPTAFLDPRGGF